MENCPWSGFVVDPFPFCEEQLCAIIGQPANTWSNIGYLIVSILLLSNKKLTSRRYLFAFVLFCLFIGSGIFHMTGTLWAKRLDLTAMLMLSSLILTESLTRQYSLRLRTTLGIYMAFLLVSIPAIGIGRAGGIIFLVQSLLAATIEIIGVRKRLQKPSERQLRYIYRALAIFAVAFLINMLDQNGILCDPQNHILTGHGVWHLMSAYCIYLVAKYYTLDLKKTA